jgi:hypothetical protein
VQEKELLFSTGVRIGPVPARLGDETAERLLLIAANQGKDWLEVCSQLDMDRAAMSIADECVPYAEKRHAEFVRQVTNENSDRANLQRQSIERHYRRQLEIKERIRDQHIRNGKTRLVPAIEGQLRKLEAITEMRLRRLEEGVVPRARCDEVCMGVILVEG